MLSWQRLQNATPIFLHKPRLKVSDHLTIHGLVAHGRVYLLVVVVIL